MPFINKLNDEIVDEIDGLSKMDLGTDEYRITIEGVTKLIDRATKYKEIDAETERQSKKIEAEAEAQAKARDDEYALRTMQMRDERLDKIVRNVLTGFTFGGTMFTIWCLASATFTFEEKGTITSSLGRKVLGMLVPKLTF